MHVDGNLNITGDAATVRKASKPTFKPITEDDIEVEMDDLPLADDIMRNVQIPKVDIGEDVHD